MLRSTGYLCTMDDCRVSRVLRRTLANHGRSVQAPGCPERIDFKFLKWVWQYTRATASIAPVFVDASDCDENNGTPPRLDRLRGSAKATSSRRRGFGGYESEASSTESEHSGRHVAESRAPKSKRKSRSGVQYVGTPHRCRAVRAPTDERRRRASRFRRSSARAGVHVRSQTTEIGPAGERQTL